MSVKIKQLCIENFRGVRRLQLDVEGRHLIVVGENGSGKSSIVDALEYYFTGTLQKLSGRADVDKRESIPHLLGGPTRVEMAFSGGDGAAVEPFAVPFPRRGVRPPPALRATFEMANDHPFVLRRAQILNFVNARPSERYEEISKIVGLGELDRIDRTWRRQRKALAGETAQREKEVARIYEELGESLTDIIRSEDDLLNALDEWLLSAGLDAVQAREEIADRLRQLRSRLRADDEREAVHALRRVAADAASAREALQDFLAHKDALLARVRAYRRRTQEVEDADWEKLLAEAHHLLHNDGAKALGRCPLCEQTLDAPQAFLARLAERVAELKTMTTLRRELRQEANALAGEVGALRALLQALDEAAQQAGLGLDTQTVEQAAAQLAGWQATLQDEALAMREAMPWREEAAVQGLLDFLERAERAAKQHADGLAWDDDTESQYQLLQKLSVVDEQWQRLQGAQARLALAETLCAQVSAVYEELIAARVRGVDRLSRELEADFDRFYQQLHPGEGYEEISIAPQEDRRSSVDLTARFQGQDPAHPLGFWSEGHLDSLGLCVFLAFICRYNGGFKLVALDDVLTTVDAGHRLRVARLLAHELSGHQLIITTHDRLWAQQLHSALPNSKLVALKPWSFEQGTDTQENVLPDWDYYEQQARDGHAQDAIVGVGRNLEKFLYQMRANLGLAVPARADEAYTIGDLFPPFKNWVSGHAVERPDRPAFREELSNLLAEVDETRRLRNWAGAHHNEWAETVTRGEAIAFLRAVRELAACFECPVCHNLVVYNHTAGALICPMCRPQAPRRADSWQYDPRWLGRAVRLKGATRPDLRDNLQQMTVAHFDYFLQDMRRRVQLPVPASARQRYAAAELYVPFLRWARGHPRPGVENWREALDHGDQALRAFRANGQWRIAPADVDQFLEVVQTFITLFACGGCGQLMSYDVHEERYYCEACDGNGEAHEAVSAYWFVTGR